MPMPAFVNKMVTKELISYIKRQLQRGASKHDIKDILLKNNWQEETIEKAFQVIEEHSKPKISTKNIFISLLIFLVVILLSSVAIISYSKKPKKELPPIVIEEVNESPSIVMENMRENMLNLTSLKYKAEISKEDAYLTIDGAFNNSDTITIIDHFMVEREKNLGIETREINNTSYFRLTSDPLYYQKDMPLISFLDYLVLIEFGLCAEEEGEWVELSSEIMDFFAQLLEESTDSFKSKEESFYFEKRKKKNFDKIKQAIKSTAYYNIEEEETDKDFYSYSFSIDKNKETEFFKDALEIILGVTDENKELFYEINEEVAEIIDEIMSNSSELLDQIHGTLLIGKQDYLLYELTFNIEERELLSNLNFKIEFKDHNKEISIEIPEEISEQENE